MHAKFVGNLNIIFKNPMLIKLILTTFVFLSLLLETVHIYEICNSNRKESINIKTINEEHLSNCLNYYKEGYSRTNNYSSEATKKLQNIEIIRAIDCCLFPI